ncbi:hypothetical protein D3872_19660 [Massilia cavernae]|uniref:Chemotaxis methyl-accepting receptor HlyB-like 4HB MCP domain-containing protein n=2 Tax=Massilia cavernae TaxID=2320864 RepID=A0A418XFV6_9BURK|nr:hypothetical protein D3872_19660 [Massilia cavernae]
MRRSSSQASSTCAAPSRVNIFIDLFSQENRMVKNMKVGTRLIMGFLSVALLGAIVAGLGIWNMSKIDHLSDQMYARELLGL